MAKVVIAELDIDLNALLKSTSDLKKEIDALKNTQKELAASGDKASETFVQNEAVLKSLNSAYSNNIKAIQETGKATKTQTDQAELLNLALTQEATSISEAREQNKLLNKLRNETNVSTKEGQAQLTALNAKLDQNNAFIKQNGDAYLKQKINIGNYKEDIKSALGELNLFNGGLQQFGTAGKVAEIGFKMIGSQVKDVKNSLLGFTSSSNVAADSMQNLSADTKDGERASIGFALSQKAMAAATTVSTVATNAGSAALKIFRLALISTGIGAIVVALGSLIAFLSTTQAGIDAVTEVTRPLKAIFDSLLGLFQNVGQSLFDAFTNPKQALTSLYEFVKQNLINRFTAFGKILDGIVNLDFKKLSDGVLQAGTGVENLTDKVKGAAQSTGKFLTDAAKKGAEIDKLQKEIEKGQLAFNKQAIQTNARIKELNLISKDTSKNINERRAASEEIIRLSKEQGVQESALIQKKIKQLEIEQSLNDTSREGNQEMIDLESQLQASRERGTDAQREQIKVIAAANKEAAANQKAAADKRSQENQKAIDAEIDKSRKQIDLFIADQGFKKKSAAQEYEFNKNLFDKETADLELRLKKGKVSQLEYEIEKKNLTTNFAKTNADIAIRESERELEKIKGNSKLSIDDKLKAETDFAKLKLEQGITNEQEYQDEITRIQNEATKSREEKAISDEQLAKEKKAIDLENKRLSEEQTFMDEIDLQRQQNDLRLQEELKAAEKSGADQQLIRSKYALADQQLTATVEEKKRMDYANTLGQLAQLFGEGSKVGKAFAISQAVISGYQAVLNAYTTAQKSPITLLNPAYPAIQAGIAGAFSVGQIAKISGVKFEQGGIQEVGGQRHSDGGTKFYGEDGTMFEAERGEGIGILNRGAYSAFMDFNNRFGSGKSGNGLFAGGGIITQGVKPQGTDFTEITEAIRSIPAPVVAVEEIQTVGNRYINVKSNADF